MGRGNEVPESLRTEVIKIVIYNDDKTELDVDVSKLKTFEPIKRIPRARTAEWRRGYEIAVEDFNAS